jgi:dihydrofolate synthase/folylpolyglutamate synthase
MFDYNQALYKMLSLTDLERVSGQTQSTGRYDLRRITTLLHRLGNPHIQIPTVHVAGTKGKGSTAAMIASILSAQGYTTGLFTSPHLHSFRERIQLDGVPINASGFAELIERLWPEVLTMNAQASSGQVTTFELLTAMAFLHFYEKGADFQVIEVGLGGRLDSTNVVLPEVSVITSISLDHTKILGATLRKIAAEKAGIIKPHTPIVTSPQRPEAMGVLRKSAQANNAPFILAADECNVTPVSHELSSQLINVSSTWSPSYLSIPFLGQHQIENATTALVTTKTLIEKGFDISHDSIALGFSKVSWPCRMEVLSEEPLFIADGAHNPYSAKILQQAITEYIPNHRLIILVGLSNDKNISGIVDELAKGADLVIPTKSRHPRAVSPLHISKLFTQKGAKTVTTQSVEEATNYAFSEARAGDLIVATGSLFVAAEARETILNISPERYDFL